MDEKPEEVSNTGIRVGMRERSACIRHLVVTKSDTLGSGERRMNDEFNASGKKKKKKPRKR
jgi:hypothetical protein